MDQIGEKISAQVVTVAADFPVISEYNVQRDQAQVFKLMDATPMKLPGMNLVYDRSPSFEGLLKLQSSNYKTVVGNQEGRLLGFYSLSWGPRFLHGKSKISSYLSDFRTSGDRFAARTWRTLYPRFVKIFSEAGIESHITAILSANKIALRNLIENRKDLGFKYDFLKEIAMVNIFSIKPWRGFLKEDTQNKVELARALDESHLIDFLDQEHTKKLFGYCYKEYEWKFRQQNWPDFSADKFCVVKNPQGKIIACCLPWSPVSVKRMSVRNLSQALRLFFLFLKLFGINLPVSGGHLQTLYLTNFQMDSSLAKTEKVKILRQMLDFVLATKKGQFHMLSWPDEENLTSDENFAKYFLQKTMVSLYSVRQSSQSPLEYKAGPVGFEMALV